MQNFNNHANTGIKYLSIVEQIALLRKYYLVANYMSCTVRCGLQSIIKI